MRILGIASEIEIAKLQEEHGWILIDGESIEAGFKFVRDTFMFTDKRIMFTDKRIILIDVQGITGRKKEYLSIPYDQISKFSVETPGPLDLDAEIKLWVRSIPEPIEKKVNFETKIKPVLQILSNHVLNR